MDWMLCFASASASGSFCAAPPRKTDAERVEEQAMIESFLANRDVHQDTAAVKAKKESSSAPTLKDQKLVTKFLEKRVQF